MRALRPASPPRLSAVPSIPASPSAPPGKQIAIQTCSRLRGSPSKLNITHGDKATGQHSAWRWDGLWKVLGGGLCQASGHRTLPAVSAGPVVAGRAAPSPYPRPSHRTSSFDGPGQGRGRGPWAGREGLPRDHRGAGLGQVRALLLAIPPAPGQARGRAGNKMFRRVVSAAPSRFSAPRPQCSQQPSGAGVLFAELPSRSAHLAAVLPWPVSDGLWGWGPLGLRAVPPKTPSLGGAKLGVSSWLSKSSKCPPSLLLTPLRPHPRPQPVR